MGYCALASCVHRHPTRRACLIGRTRKKGACPDYRARPPRAASWCQIRSCAHFYQENWRARCRLGLKFSGRKAECGHYAQSIERRERRKVGTCSRSSCAFWYRSEAGRYRCRLGLTRRSGQECPRYAKKAGRDRSRSQKRHQKNGSSFALPPAGSGTPLGPV